MHGGATHAQLQLGRSVRAFICGFILRAPVFPCVSTACAGYGRLFVELRFALAPKGLGLCGGICGANIPRVTVLRDTRPTRRQNYHWRGKIVQRKGVDGGAKCVDARFCAWHKVCNAPPTPTSRWFGCGTCRVHEIEAERNVRGPILDEDYFSTAGRREVWRRAKDSRLCTFEFLDLCCSNCSLCSDVATGAIIG